MGRLMKYDLRAAMKLFVPLWIGTLILSLINSFTIYPQSDVESKLADFFISLMMIAYVLAVIAIVIVTVIYVVMRFYQSMMKDEAYLTFTLPVGIDAILWAKAIVGLILLAISAVVCVLSLLILSYPIGYAADIPMLFSRLMERITVGNLLMVILAMVLAAITTCMSGIFHGYLSMGFGQLAKKRKLGASVLAYVVISTVTSAFAGVVIMPLFVKLMENMGQTSVLLMFNGAKGVWLIFLLISLYNLIFTAVYYFPTRYIFKNKLNLE